MLADLKNPFIAASGTCGLVHDAPSIFKLHLFAAVVVKTLTKLPRKGNPPPRFWEVPCGLLNSVGLENPGVESFLLDHLPRISLPKDVQLWLSAGGEDAEEVVEVCGEFAKCKESFSAVELNLSCPNISGRLLCEDKELVRFVVSGAKEVLRDKPVYAKLSPVGDIECVAEAALDAGADGLVVANTFPAMALNEQMRPALGGRFGGLSGPVVKPMVLRLVWRLWTKFGCDIIASGGVGSGRDAVEFIAVGAAAVQIGSLNLIEPGAIQRIITQFEKELKRLGLTVEQLRGYAHRGTYNGG